MARAGVQALYKRKGVKARPVDEKNEKGQAPASEDEWMMKCLDRYYDGGVRSRSTKFGDYLHPRIALFLVGYGLTNERFANAATEESHAGRTGYARGWFIFDRRGTWIKFRGLEVSGQKYHCRCVSMSFRTRHGKKRLSSSQGLSTRNRQHVEGTNQSQCSGKVTRALQISVVLSSRRG